MRIFKKAYLILLFIVSFTSYGFSNCGEQFECECNAPVRIEFVEVTETAQISNYIKNYLWINYDTTVLHGYYEGFNVSYLTTKLDSVWEDSVQTALLGDTCDCFSNIIQLAKSYPVSIQVFAKYTLNDTIPRNTNVTNFLTVLPYSDLSFRKNQGRIEIDSTLLLKQYFQKGYAPQLLFLLENIYLKNDSAQFIIETTLNTRQVLTTETPLVIFK